MVNALFFMVIAGNMKKGRNGFYGLWFEANWFEFQPRHGTALLNTVHSWRGWGD